MVADAIPREWEAVRMVLQPLWLPPRLVQRRKKECLGRTWPYTAPAKVLIASATPSHGLAIAIVLHYIVKAGGATLRVCASKGATMHIAGKWAIAVILLTTALTPQATAGQSILIEYAGSTLWTGLGGVSAQGEYVYAAMPFGLLIFRNHEDTALELIDELRILPGSWSQIKALHNRAFLISNREVLVMDISDPVHPVAGGSVPLPTGVDGLPAWILAVDVISACTCIAIAYQGTGIQGVWHITGSDFQAPSVVASYATTFEVWGISAGSSFAGVFGFSYPDAVWLEFWNIEKPRAPSWVDEYWTGSPIDYAVAVSIQANLAYMVCSEFGVRIVAIDSIPNDSVLGTYPESSATDIRIENDRAYLFNSDSGLTTLAFTDSVTLYSLGSAVPPGTVADIDGNLFYVTTPTPELKLVDWTQPTSPVVRDTYDNFRPPTLFVSVRDRVAFVSSGTMGIQVVDIADPKNPVWNGTISLSGAAGLSTIVGEYLYVVKEDSTIDIIAVSDVTNATVVGNFRPASLPRDFLLNGDVLMMAVSDSGLQLVSVADPANPVNLDRVDLPGATYCIALDGNLGCAAGANPLLKVLDFSDPQAPQLVGQFNMSTSGLDVEVADSIVYIATSFHGEFVVDVHAPATPLLITQHVSLGPPWGLPVVDRVGDYLLVVRQGDIYMLNISDPWNTQWVGMLPTPGTAKQMVIAPPWIYVADWSGFTVLSVSGTTDVAGAQAELPSDFSLGRNYPNPFNAGTRIHYTLERAHHVELTIFNLLGRQVKQLVNSSVAPGSYSVFWDGCSADGRDAPSGVYFYRLVVDGQSETQKMLMLR